MTNSRSLPGGDHLIIESYYYSTKQVHNDLVHVLA